MDAKDAKFKDELEAWRKVAFEGKDALIAKKNPKGLKEIEVTTDLGGEISVTLEPGTWYVNGSATVGKSAILWNDVPVVVKPGLGKFELSNDNGTVL
jgi:hypothetical protein